MQHLPGSTSLSDRTVGCRLLPVRDGASSYPKARPKSSMLPRALALPESSTLLRALACLALLGPIKASWPSLARSGLITNAGLCLRSPSTLRRKRAHDQRSVCRGRDGQVERSMGATRSLECLPLIKQRPASALACHAYTPQRINVLLVWGETLYLSDVCTFSPQYQNAPKFLPRDAAGCRTQ